jgi:2-oxoglutarate dehydrogenase E2 component (dihydrolipoamide succinyltransferase)
MATDITVPTLGESVAEATIAQWLKKAGDTVARDEPVAELETDKVTLEVNAPAAGTLSEVIVSEGDTVEVGTLIGRIVEGQAAAAAPPAKGDGGGKTAESAPATQDTAPKAAPAAGGDGGGNGGGETVDVPVPSLGESVSEASIAQWLKQPGDAVQQDEAIAELETDKVTLEVNAPAAGTLAEQLVAEGGIVTPGSLVARVTKGAAPSADAAKPAQPSQPAAAETSAQQTATHAAEAPASADRAPATGALDPGRAPRTEGRVTRQDLERFLSGGPEAMNPEDLSPAVRKLVHDHDLDPTRIPASGPGGRLTKDDVMAVVEGRTQLLEVPRPEKSAPAPAEQAAQQQPAASQAPAPSTTGGAGGDSGPAEGARREERVKMTRLRQTIAKRLKEAQNTAAMLSTFNEIDMTAVQEVRQRYKDDFEKAHGTRLGMSCFFAKAVVQALKELPAVNARIEGDEIVYNHYYDIGMAVSTPNGLMVPVVRDVDTKSMAEIESSLRDLAKKGRDGKLSMDELQGATFSITNGGVFGSLLSTPIINPPQSGILGMHKIQDRPMAVNGEVKIRPMMYVALSYDHRIVDGREAVTFLVRVKECLEDPTRLLLQM